MQAPRTMRSIDAPACAAATSASISAGSVSALTLATMRAGWPGARRLGHLADVAHHAPVQRNGAVSRCAAGARGLAGQLQEDRVGVGGQAGSAVR
jgi:hypothetical protein